MTYDQLHVTRNGFLQISHTATYQFRVHVLVTSERSDFNKISVSANPTNPKFYYHF